MIRYRGIGRYGGYERGGIQQSFRGVLVDKRPDFVHQSTAKETRRGTKPDGRRESCRGLAVTDAAVRAYVRGFEARPVPTARRPYCQIL